MNAVFSIKKAPLAIAWVTFQEILRDKVLYNIFLFGMLLFGVSYAASTLTFITPERVVLDVGFSAINLSCALIAILNGSSMLAKEFERRTIFVALARPITRLHFVTGKYIGLCGIVGMNWLLLAVMETLLYRSLGGAFTASFFIALFFLLLQSWVLAAISVMVSSFTTTSISVIIVIGVYMLGNNVSEILKLIAKLPNEVLRTILESGTYLIPNLEHYNLGFQVTYLLPIVNKSIVVSLVYTLLLVSLSLFFAGRLLEKREA